LYGWVCGVVCGVELCAVLCASSCRNSSSAGVCAVVCVAAMYAAQARRAIDLVSRAGGQTDACCHHLRKTRRRINGRAYSVQASSWTPGWTARRTPFLGQQQGQGGCATCRQRIYVLALALALAERYILNQNKTAQNLFAAAFFLCWMGQVVPSAAFVLPCACGELGAKQKQKEPLRCCVSILEFDLRKSGRMKQQRSAGCAPFYPLEPTSGVFTLMGAHAEQSRAG